MNCRRRRCRRAAAVAGCRPFRRRDVCLVGRGRVGGRRDGFRCGRCRLRQVLAGCCCQQAQYAQALGAVGRETSLGRVYRLWPTSTGEHRSVFERRRRIDRRWRVLWREGTASGASWHPLVASRISTISPLRIWPGRSFADSTGRTCDGLHGCGSGDRDPPGSVSCRVQVPRLAGAPGIQVATLRPRPGIPSSAQRKPEFFKDPNALRLERVHPLCRHYWPSSGDAGSSVPYGASASRTSLPWPVAGWAMAAWPRTPA